MIDGRPAAAALAVALLLATSCGGAAPSPPPSSAGASADPLSGTLTVFAAASLSQAFSAAQAAQQARHPGLTLRFSFAGSQQLVMQILDGAPADVVATADGATMQRLVDAGLAVAPRVFATNRLEIVVAPGNPRHVRGLADLARPGLAVVLADPTVPAGRFARQALAAAGVTVTPKAFELDVESVLHTVVAGDADAAIVYATDARQAAGTVDGVPIPDAQNVVASYPVAVVTGSAHRAAATAFVKDVMAGTTHDELLARGFLPP